MNSLHTLYSELQLQEKAGPIPRLLHLAAVATGSFRRRLPVMEMTPAEYLKVLLPGSARSARESVDDREDHPLPWKNIPPEMIPDSIVKAADKIVQKDFSFYGSRYRCPDGIDWHHSFGTRPSWPKNHWSEILFRTTYRLGDIKVSWEMNRHQFFTTLALAGIKTGDAQYARTFVALFNEWCEQNPPEIGINYISSLEIGIRCISWIFADQIFRRSPAYDKETRDRMHRHLYSQALHIAEYLSDIGKTGRDHRLIGAAAALAFITLHYPEWKNSAQWQEQAFKVLWPAFDEQIYSDGMHFESSFGYHLLVAEFMTLLFAEMRRKNKAIPSKAHVLLEKMVTVLRLARLPDDTLPNINDNDDSTALPLAQSLPQRLQCLFAAAATLYERPDFKVAAKGIFNLGAFLMLGERGAEDLRIVPEYAEDFPLLTQFKESHLYILRHKDDYILLKNNPDPYPKSGHNHADQLHMILIMNKKPVLIDAGTFRYHDDRGYRNALRSTAAHNTITVDLKGQATPEGNFDWDKTTRTGFGDTFENDDMVLIDAQHDSYHNLGVSHRRLILWMKKDESCIVIDQLQGQRSHYFEQFWHFTPQARLESYKGHNYRLFNTDGLAAHIRFCGGDDKDQVEIVNGSDHNKPCSFSARYGEVEAAPALKRSWTNTLSFEHNSYRMTVFGKDFSRENCAEPAHAQFEFGDWHIDLNHVPARVSKIN